MVYSAPSAQIIRRTALLWILSMWAAPSIFIVLRKAIGSKTLKAIQHPVPFGGGVRNHSHCGRSCGKEKGHQGDCGQTQPGLSKGGNGVYWICLWQNGRSAHGYRKNDRQSDERITRKKNAKEELQPGLGNQKCPGSDCSFAISRMNFRQIAERFFANLPNGFSTISRKGVMFSS